MNAENIETLCNEDANNLNKSSQEIKEAKTPNLQLTDQNVLISQAEVKE